jgi:multimeric flavodoxin WrbA
MKIYVLHGGPRLKWNTHMMCESFADGARSVGADVEVIHLFDLNYRGCYSCFACKLKGGKSYGRCGHPDEIHDLLDRVAQADGVVFASPIYFGDVTAQLRGFAERLFFPFNSFDAEFHKLAPKRLATAVIYTMNVKEPVMDSYVGRDGEGPIGFFERWIETIFTKPERICAFDTYQFRDYTKYLADGWNEKEKAERRKLRFPKDLQNAFDAGTRMVGKISTME